MKLRYLLPFISVFVLFSCLKKDDLNLKNLKLSDWNPSWAAPLTNTTLTLKNLVQHVNTGKVLTTDSTGLYSIHYDGRLLSFTAGDYIKIPDQSFTTNGFGLKGPISLSSFTGSVSDTFSDHYSYTDTSGAQLQHLKIKSGSLQLQIYSSYQHNVSAQLIFPLIKKNSTPLSIPIITSASQHNFNQQIDLSNYVADFTNGGTANNYLAYKIEYTITGTGNPISTSDTIGATVKLQNLQFSFVDGYLGHHQIPISMDTIPIEIFNNTLNASIFLENPVIKLAISNSFGITASATFSKFDGILKNGSIHNIGGSFFSTPIVLNGPTTANAPAVTNNYQIDKTNSGVQTVFNPAPTKIVFKGNIEINGTGSPTYNFVSDTSKIEVNAEAVLPAWFRIDKFELQDTFDLTLPHDTDILRNAEFKMLTENGFGLYAQVQLYFTDSAYHVLDSLVNLPVGQTYLIPQAPVNANGKVIGSTSQAAVFSISKNRYHKLAPKVAHAIVKGTLESSGSGSNISVKIYQNDFLRIQLGAKLDLHINSLSQ